MKAMILQNPDKCENKPLKFVEIPIPTFLENEILLKVICCGVCHTDLHIIEGDIHPPSFPIILGHEIIGKVVDFGQNVKNVTKGDKMGAPWLYSTCNNCDYCKKGNENLCENAKFTGFSVNGGFAEYIVVKETYAFKIPENLDSFHAAPLMCAGIIGYRSYKLSEIQPGETLGLFGFGASAHIVLQIAKFYGIETFVFTRSPNHQKHAKELGATWVGSSKDTPPKKVQRAISFAPVGELILDILDLLDKRGTLAINAVYLTDIPPISWDRIYYEKKIISVANTTREDGIEFLQIASIIPLNIAIKKFHLSQANEAIIEMKYSKFNGAAVIDMNSKNL